MCLMFVLACADTSQSASSAMSVTNQPQPGLSFSGANPDGVSY